ncbi:MAG: tRNA lysidine(34) synthetase TilS [Acetatifactor sp.]
MEKVFSFIRQYEMIHPGDKVVLGVSGGADSVCLLFVLLEYSRRVPLELAVVHINHGIRADAGADAAYVEGLCRSLGIPFFLVEKDVKALAAALKCSEEDAGRRLRYGAFREIAGQLGATKIAVAHNADDRAETMLLHLFRGSGLKGLRGIEPVRDDIIRPLLCLERKEIEEYLKDKGISWRTDSTNNTDAYARNRIRHHILPYAEEQISGKVVAHMCRTAELLSETEKYMSQQTEEARRQCVEGNCIDVAKFKALPGVLQKRLLLELLEELSPTGKDISAVHVEDVRGLFEGTGNRQICLPFGIIFKRQYRKVLMEVKDTGEEEPVRLPSLEYQTIMYGPGMEIPENKYTKWFDYDKIKEAPTLRFRQTGDYLTVSDGRGNIIHKSLKDYMVTEKIPRELRDSIPVLAEGRHILWLIGYRISEYYKVNQNTKYVMQVKLKENCAEEELEEKNGRAYQGT